jgi:outer membrane immunogenic protein
MRQIIIAVIAATALGVACEPAALAADMPVKAAPLAPAAYDWSGIYIGGDAGWQASRINLSADSGPLTYSATHSSLAVGGFAGIQRQFGQYVLGIEGGYMSAFNEASLGVTPSVFIFSPGGVGTGQTRLKDIWNIGGRAGWAMNRWMPYVTAGYASGGFRFNAQSALFNEAVSARANAVYAGAGIDWALTNNWILGAEYRHYWFGTTTDLSIVPGFTENVTFRPSTDTVLARLSYKFGWMR